MYISTRCMDFSDGVRFSLCRYEDTPVGFPIHDAVAPKLTVSAAMY